MYNTSPEDFFSKEEIEKWKRIGKHVRKITSVLREDSYYMSEAELTEEQRESRKPIGTKGLYRMYRWECIVCPMNGKKMPYSEAIQSGYEHCIEYKHSKSLDKPPIKIISGTFPKGDLYQE